MLQLQKRIENKNIYYLVVDLKAGCFKDMFYICPENAFPILEEYIYQIMADVLDFSFKNTKYDGHIYKTNLFLLHRLDIVNGNVLIETIKPLTNLYISLKYELLDKVIYIMNHKLTIEGVNNLKIAVLKTNFVSELGTNGMKLLEDSAKIICPKKDMYKFFNELIKLIIDQSANDRINYLNKADTKN